MIRARETCHALGLPHVTLDLREAFRDTVVQAFVDGYAAGLTPNPCMRCNGAFRFDALVAFAERVGADVLWTGHYARIVERDGMRLVARGVDPAKDQSYMLATVDPALLDRIGFPARGRDQGRGAGGSGVGRSRGRAPTREPGGVLPGGRRLPPLPRAQRARAVPGRHRGRGGDGARAPRWPLAVHARPAPRPWGRLPRAAPRHPLRARVEHARRRASQRPRSPPRDRAWTPLRRGRARPRRSSATARPPSERTSRRAGRASPSSSHEPVEAVAPGQVAVLYDRDVVVGAGVIASATG